MWEFKITESRVKAARIVSMSLGIIFILSSIIELIQPNRYNYLVINYKWLPRYLEIGSIALETSYIIVIFIQLVTGIKIILFLVILFFLISTMSLFVLVIDVIFYEAASIHSHYIDQDPRGTVVMFTVYVVIFYILHLVRLLSVYIMYRWFEKKSISVKRGTFGTSNTPEIQ
ncbi:unnamed protein product [Caenorhabditis brenneri]